MIELSPSSVAGASRARRTYWRTVRQARLVWHHRGLDAADLVLASYPRSGNLWMRVLLLEAVAGEVDFEQVHTWVRDIGRQQQARRLLPGGGRIIKTHEPYRRAYRRALYLVRDPRDVAVSYFKHLQRRGTLLVSDAEQAATFDLFLGRFLEGRYEPFGRWQPHVLSWLSDNAKRHSEVFVLRYEDLRHDASGQFARVADWLELGLDDAALERAVAGASIESVRALTRRYDLDTDRRLGRAAGRLSSVNAGLVGGWRDVLTAEQAARFAVFNDALALLGYETA